MVMSDVFYCLLMWAPVDTKRDTIEEECTKTTTAWKTRCVGRYPLPVNIRVTQFIRSKV